MLDNLLQHDGRIICILVMFVMTTNLASFSFYDIVRCQIIRYTGPFTFYHTILTKTTLSKKLFENIMRKGENVGNQHFLLFAQCFQYYRRQK